MGVVKQRQIREKSLEQLDGKTPEAKRWLKKNDDIGEKSIGNLDPSQI